MKKNKYPTDIIRTIVLFIAFAVSTNTFAATSPVKTDLYVSLGNLCEFLDTYQIDQDGSKNKCSFLPTLSSSLDFNLTSKFVFMPQIGLTMPKSGTDENIKRITFFTLANMKYKSKFINFIGGAGLYVTRISGPGGEAELKNGLGTDSFPLPSEPVYSRNFIVNLGLGHDFNKEWSGEVYTYIFNALKSEDRALSLGATISYHFGDVQ